MKRVRSAVVLYLLLVTASASAEGYTAGGEGRRLVMLVHHDDGEREYAYDRQSPVGRLDKGLDEAERRRWGLISIKRDWRKVFPEKTRSGRPPSRP